MIMLDELKEKLDEIEVKDSFAFEFVESILVQKEEQPDKKLSKKQFKILVEIHNKFARGK